jgi:hypothetical protein
VKLVRQNKAIRAYGFKMILLLNVGLCYVSLQARRLI